MRCVGSEAQYYKHDYPKKLITSGGLGTMGFALPAAVGCRFAQPEEEIWVIAGDGGFQMTAAELSTCAQENIKLNIAIINNGYLGMVRQWQQFFFQGRYATTRMLSPDFVKLVETHGLSGYRVDRRDQVAPVVERARREEGTVAIDRREAIKDCFSFLDRFVEQVHTISRADVEAAKELAGSYQSLSGRDCLHLAVMKRHGLSLILTFDQAFLHLSGIEYLPRREAKAL